LYAFNTVVLPVASSAGYVHVQEFRSTIHAGIYLRAVKVL